MRAERTSLTRRSSQSISRLGVRIDLRLRLRPFGDDQLVGPLAHRVPQLLGDERHQRVEHHEDLVERPGGDALGLVVERALDQLDVPVAEGAPDEVVDGVGHLVVAQLVERAVELGQRLDHLADDPAVDRKLGGGRGDAVAGADAVHLQEARGVPQLGREVAVALDALLIELDVAALAFHRRQREAQRVGAIFVDQAERVDGVALRLGHFLRPARRGRGRGGRASSTAPRP